VGGSKETTNQSTKTEIPQEIRDRGSAITSGAMGQYGPGSTPYNAATYAQQGKDRTGQLTPYHATAGTAVDNAQTSFQPFMDEAADASRGAYATTRGQGYADSVQDFMNPYESGVLDNIDYNRDVGINSYKDVAAKSGAFGNDRRAIGEAAIYSDANRQKNDLRYQGYNNAVGQHNTAFNQGEQHAQTMADLGTTTQTNQLRGAEAADQHGNLLMAQDQAEKDAAHAAYTEPLDFYERLAAINAMQPVNRTSTSTGTSQSGGGWLGPALAAGGQAASFLSDERMKEDIADVDPETVLGAFSTIPTKTYKYTDEAREYFPGLTADGERTGFMAQDYEKAFDGEGVKDLDGVKAMDVPNVIGKLVVAVKGLEARTRKGE
jgi:hypothetical protein